jgi:hypothetical protein
VPVREFWVVRESKSARSRTGTGAGTLTTQTLKIVEVWMRLINDVLRFSLELAALVAFALWGASALSGFWAYALACGAVLLAVAYWGLLIAPKATHRLKDPVRLAAEVVFFCAAAVAALAAGRTLFALVLAPLAIANAIVLRVVGTAAP